MISLWAYFVSSHLNISAIGLERAFLSIAQIPKRIRLVVDAFVAVVLDEALLLVLVSDTGC